MTDDLDIRIRDLIEVAGSDAPDAVDSPIPVGQPNRSPWVWLAAAAAVIAVVAVGALVWQRSGDGAIEPVDTVPAPTTTPTSTAPTSTAPTTTSAPSTTVSVDPTPADGWPRVVLGDGDVLRPDDGRAVSGVPDTSGVIVGLDGVPTVVGRLDGTRFYVADPSTGAFATGDTGRDESRSGAIPTRLPSSAAALSDIAIGPTDTVYGLYSGSAGIVIGAFPPNSEPSTQPLATWPFGEDQQGNCMAVCTLIPWPEGFGWDAGVTVPYVDVNGNEVDGPAAASALALTTEWVGDDLPSSVTLSGPDLPSPVQLEGVVFNPDLNRMAERQADGSITLAVNMGDAQDRSTQQPRILWFHPDGTLTVVDLSNVPGTRAVLVDEDSRLWTIVTGPDAAEVRRLSPDRSTIVSVLGGLGPASSLSLYPDLAAALPTLPDPVEVDTVDFLACQNDTRTRDWVIASGGLRILLEGSDLQNARMTNWYYSAPTGDGPRVTGGNGLTIGSTRDDVLAVYEPTAESEDSIDVDGGGLRFLLTDDVVTAVASISCGD